VKRTTALGLPSDARADCDRVSRKPAPVRAGPLTEQESLATRSQRIDGQTRRATEIWTAGDANLAEPLMRNDCLGEPDR
jgi:hypothetical protein